METYYATYAASDNPISRKSVIAKNLKKTVSGIGRNPYALHKAKALQTLHKDKAQLHIFSMQFSRLIDAIPDVVLLKDREGRKQVTNQLTKPFFKQHELDWHCKTDKQIQANPMHGRRSLTSSELHLALEKHQLKLYYQMQVNSAGQMLGAEVLLRWEHPRYGLITPDQFIPLAEQTGLILPIGAWVLQTACEQLKQWQNEPLKKQLSLAVNISPLQFSHTKFVNQLNQILEITDIDATRLQLELTESLMPHDIANTIEKMKALQLLGILFSIDNFGTGYSSLSQLKKLPINQLKIDPFLTRNIAIDSCDAMLVKIIVDMTQKLGVNVIASGVETKQQFTCLKQLGCSAYQGYLFGNPMPLDVFEKLIRNVHKNNLGNF